MIPTRHMHRSTRTLALLSIANSACVTARTECLHVMSVILKVRIKNAAAGESAHNGLADNYAASSYIVELIGERMSHLIASLPVVGNRSTPAGPLAGVGQQLLDVGLEDSVADIAKELLPPFVEHEGGAAFDKMPVFGIEVRTQRCMGRATVDLSADSGKRQGHARGDRFLIGPIGDVLQIPEKAETTTPHCLFEHAPAAKPLLVRRRDFTGLPQKLDGFEKEVATRRRGRNIPGPDLGMNVDVIEARRHLFHMPRIARRAALVAPAGVYVRRDIAEEAKKVILHADLVTELPPQLI